MEADRSIKSVNEAVCKARLDYSFQNPTQNKKNKLGNKLKKTEFLRN